MINTIRHNFSLFLCLLVTFAGVALLTFGLFNSYGAYKMLDAVEFEQKMGLVVRWDVVSYIMAAHVLTATLGLILLIFATRAFIKTWKSGPPTESSVIGKTGFSRVIWLLIYGAGAVYGTYGLIFATGPFFRDAQLALQGDTVLAVVRSIEAAPEIHWDSYRVYYDFKTQTGEMVSGSNLHYSYRANRILSEGNVEVTYLVSDPNVQKMLFSFSPLGMLYFFSTQLALVMVGVWGFAKNARAFSSTGTTNMKYT